jgi:hypothetical protein
VKKILIIFLITLFIVQCSLFSVYGQGPPPAPTEEDVPIAGDLLLLLISGIGYGIMKFNYFRKQKLVRSNED